MLVLMPVCVTLTLTNVAEAPYQPRQQVSVLAGLKLMAANGPFKRLVLAFMIGSLGLNVTTPLYLFFHCRCFAGGRQGDLYAQLSFMRRALSPCHFGSLFQSEWVSIEPT